MSDHRGRSLGTRVKAANLLALLEQLPAVRRVTTWNARTNEPMLLVNRKLGFHPVGVSTEWQKIGQASTCADGSASRRGQAPW